MELVCDDEHGLQLVNNQQSLALPSDAASMQQTIRFMGADNKMQYISLQDIAPVMVMPTNTAGQ